MKTPIFEVIAPNGPNDLNVLGYMRLAGAEPLYLPYECRAALHGTIGWMTHQTFRAHLGIPLVELALRPMHGGDWPVDRSFPSYADVERVALLTVARLLRQTAQELEEDL